MGASVVYYVNIELGSSIYFYCILCDLFTEKQKINQEKISDAKSPQHSN